MRYKRIGFVGCCMLLAAGSALLGGIPFVQKQINKRITHLVAEATEPEVISIKTTRSIPEDADMGAYLAALLAHERKDYSAALHYYARVLEKDPENRDVQTMVFKLGGLTDHIDEMIKLSYDLTDEDVGGVLRLYAQATDLFEKGQFQDVIQMMRADQSKSHQKFFMQAIIVAWSYASLNDEKKALAALESLTDPEVDSIRIYNQALLNDYFGHGQKALALYKDLAKRSLLSLNAWRNTSFVLAANGLLSGDNPVVLNLDPIKKEPQLYGVLTKINPPLIRTPKQAVAEGFYLVMRSLVYANEYEHALLIANLALHIDESAVVTRIFAAELSNRLGMPEQAIRLYDKFPSEIPYIAFQKARILTQAGDYKGALALLSELEKKQKDLNSVYDLMAEIFFYLDQKDKVIEYYTKLIELPKVQTDDKLRAHYHMLLGNIYLLENNSAQMTENLMTAIRLDPENVEALNTLGYEMIDTGTEVEKGLDLVKRAYHLAPTDAHVLDSLAWGYYKLGRLDNALAYQKKALKRLKGNAVIHLHLGDIYQALGRFRDARAQYVKALAAKEGLTPEIESELARKLGDQVREENKTD